MLIENDKNDLPFDAASPKKLAKPLVNMAGLSVGQRKAMGSGARESVPSALDPDQIVGLMESFYEASIAKGIQIPPDLWCSSLLRPGDRCPKPRRPGMLRRVVQKVGRMLNNV